MSRNGCDCWAVGDALRDAIANDTPQSSQGSAVSGKIPANDGPALKSSAKMAPNKSQVGSRAVSIILNVTVVMGLQCR